MGKLTLTGPVPPDDPMFTGGPEVFSRRSPPREANANDSGRVDASSGGTSGGTPESRPSEKPYKSTR